MFDQSFQRPASRQCASADDSIFKWAADLHLRLGTKLEWAIAFIVLGRTLVLFDYIMDGLRVESSRVPSRPVPPGLRGRQEREFDKHEKRFDRLAALLNREIDMGTGGYPGS